METVSSLKDLLLEFTAKETYLEIDINREFERIARKIIYGGYIKVESYDSEGKKVNHEVRFYDVEAFFFSERPNGFRDWMVFHRNRKVRSKYILPEYFPVGCLFPYSAGLAISLEKKACYRASILLGSYRIDNGKIQDNPDNLNNILFMGFSPFGNCSIKWVDEKVDRSKVLGKVCRKNIPMFEASRNGDDPKKIDAKRANPDFEDTITENLKYVQDPKQWRFFDSSVYKIMKRKNVIYLAQQK